MSKHTPGPWSFEYTNSESSGGGQWYQITGEDGDSLLWFPYKSSSEVSEECKANAALMAAAPDLLHAAKSALEAAESIIHEYLDGTRVCASALAELQSVRDAIAKAEGEA